MINDEINDAINRENFIDNFHKMSYDNYRLTIKLYYPFLDFAISNEDVETDYIYNIFFTSFSNNNYYALFYIFIEVNYKIFEKIGYQNFKLVFKTINQDFEMVNHTAQIIYKNKETKVLAKLLGFESELYFI
jgi:hypothetical protein